MSKFNKKKQKSAKIAPGIIAGAAVSGAGVYTNEELLRRVVMTNLLWESTYYQEADEIMKQMDMLLPKVNPQYIYNLAIEVRFEQKLRHTPIYLALSLYRDHKASSLCADALSKICTRPDMTMDTLAMLPLVIRSVKKTGKKIRRIPKCVKKGLAKAFDNYDYYQISKYRKTNSDISLVDVVNLMHPVPTKENEEALRDLVKDQMRVSDTWESGLSKGGNKKEVFTDLLSRGKLGGLALLRNLRNMESSGVKRSLIIDGLRGINSRMLTPLNFLAAARNAPSLVKHINEAMKNAFVTDQIKGTTIIALDVSGSMGGLTSQSSKFSRLDLGFALVALACYTFEDPIVVYTAGTDWSGKGAHMLAPTLSGLGVFEDATKIRSVVGQGGIFTSALCKWLKKEGLADKASRLVVISDSQDMGRYKGDTSVPDTSPYDTSYIIDISHHTHGIKSGNWTAEINGSSDKLFHYIKELERK